MEKLDAVMKEFWTHLASTQKPTMLEIIARDINSGKYAPSFSKQSDPKQDVVDEKDQEEASDPESAPVPVQDESRTSRRTRAINKKDENSKVAESEEILSEKKTQVAVNAEAEEENANQDKDASRAYFDMSAWDLRDALRLACGRDDEGDWTEIHQVLFVCSLILLDFVSFFRIANPS